MPDKSNPRVSMRKYWFFIRSGVCVEFSSKKDVDKFQLKLSRWLNERALRLLDYHSELLNIYWRNWVFMDEKRNGSRKKNLSI